MSNGHGDNRLVVDDALVRDVVATGLKCVLGYTHNHDAGGAVINFLLIGVDTSRRQSGLHVLERHVAINRVHLLGVDRLTGFNALFSTELSRKLQLLLSLASISGLVFIFVVFTLNSLHAEPTSIVLLHCQLFFLDRKSICNF